MWSAQQQSMLNTLGYTLYVRPSARAVGLQTETSLEVVASKAMPDCALFKAVMKAAQGKSITALEINMETLRQSPKAKRALWSQLRRLIKA